MSKAAWQSAIAVGVATVVMIRDHPLGTALIGLLIAGVFFRYYPRWQDKTLDAALRRGAAAAMAGPGPHICEVELRPDGIWVRQLQKQSIHEWPTVEAVSESADSIELFTNDGTGVIVRNRAFPTDTDRLRFVEIARSNLAARHGATGAESQAPNRSPLA